MKKMFAVFSFGILLASSPALAEGDAVSGKKLFKKCAACHSIEEGKHKVGPSMYGIFERQAGTVEGFRYSKALKNADLVWNAENLDGYLAKPRKFIPGNKMAYAGLRKAAQRADITAYLKTLK